jgi:hypothetical protein
VRKRGTLTSALGARWCRALAVIAVCFLAVQSMRLPLLTAEARAACCCPHHAENADCKCPVCTELRELRFGKPYFKSCGPSAEVVALIPFAPALPSVNAAAPKPPLPMPVPARAESAPPDPAPDVPTPPPLALV